MKLIFLICLAIIAAHLSPSALSAQRHDDILVKALESYSKINNYSCYLYKKELVGTTYYEDANILVKFKKPHSYYIKWTQGDDKGQEVIYSEGRYNNKLQAHIGGFFSFLTFSLDPTGLIALRKTHHPIYHLDIGYILTILETNNHLHQQLRLGTVSFEKDEMIEGVDTIKLRAEFPDGKGFYAKKIYLNFDKSTYIPIMIKTYDWNDRLKEKFYFSKIKMNTGITEKDFDLK